MRRTYAVLRAIRSLPLALLAILFLGTNIAGAANRSATSPEADPSHLLDLLKAQRFAELDRILLGLQHAYEADPRQADALRKPFAFANVDERWVGQRLDNWVGQRPRSYAAYYVRGTYYVYRGWQVRGEDYINKIKREDIAEMERMFELAQPDLEASLTLTRQPLLTYAQLIQIGESLGWVERNRQWMEAANRIDPTNILVNRAYLMTLRPQWGGSLKAMEDFVKEAEKMPLSTEHKHQLEADMLRSHARASRIEGDNQTAVQYYTRAIALYDKDPVVFFNRGWSYHNLKDYHNALDDYSRAIALDPDYETALSNRGNVRLYLGQLDEALVDLNKALRLNPRDIHALQSRAWAYNRLKRYPEMTADYQRAADLGNADAEQELGSCFWFGKGVEKNRDQAIFWWKKAAAAGNAKAQQHLQVEGIAL